MAAPRPPDRRSFSSLPERQESSLRYATLIAMKKILLSWSSGKDSAWALHILRQQGEYEVGALLTTINSAFNRVAMHSTRSELVGMQAESVGLPLLTVPLPWPCSNQDYEAAWLRACNQAAEEGFTAIAFGDLFLQDIRVYREKQLQGTALEPLFPIWGMDTDKLARGMIESGLQARLVCVDPKKLDPSFVGRDFNLQLLDDLPPEIDPCGENGEFHTFAYGGPMFQRQLPILTGEHVGRDGFYFCDLVLA